MEIIAVVQNMNHHRLWVAYNTSDCIVITIYNSSWMFERHRNYTHILGRTLNMYTYVFVRLGWHKLLLQLECYTRVFPYIATVYTVHNVTCCLQPKGKKKKKKRRRRRHNQGTANTAENEPPQPDVEIE